MACRDWTMNGCGEVPGWWTTRPNTWPGPIPQRPGTVRRDDVSRGGVVDVQCIVGGGSDDVPAVRLAEPPAARPQVARRPEREVARQPAPSRHRPGPRGVHRVRMLLPAGSAGAGRVIGGCGLGCRVLKLFHQDRAGAAGGEVVPCPVDEDLEAIAETDEVHDVHAQPEQPRQAPADPELVPAGGPGARGSSATASPRPRTATTPLSR